MKEGVVDNKAGIVTENCLCQFRSVFFWASLIAQSVHYLPAIQETRVRFLGPEDPLRRKWQPAPVFLPGKSHGQRSLVGSHSWSRKIVGHD